MTYEVDISALGASSGVWASAQQDAYAVAEDLTQQLGGLTGALGDSPLATAVGSGLVCLLGALETIYRAEGHLGEGASTAADGYRAADDEARLAYRFDRGSVAPR